MLLRYLRCGSVCNIVVFRASGNGKAEREGGSCCWKCAAAAVRGKEPSLEKGEQKARQQKSVVQWGQRGLAAHWSCGVDRDHIYTSEMGQSGDFSPFTAVVGDHRREKSLLGRRQAPCLQLTGATGLALLV